MTKVRVRKKHDVDILASLHFKGSGFAKAGAIGRKLSIVHSRQRCQSQRRTRELCRVGRSSLFSIGTQKDRSTKTPLRCFILNGSPQLRLDRKNFLSECQKPLATGTGSARATSTGEFARFKILRVRSPMM